MAGTFLAQNKVRPGAYINFVSVPRPMITIGDRGIGTMALELDWGMGGQLIDIYSTDLLDGKSLSKIGLTATSPNAKLLNLMLSNCYLVKVFRINSDGVRAKATIGDLFLTAKYTGLFGNSISVTVEKNESLFDVITFVQGVSKDRQTVATIEELENNDFVVFSGSGDLTTNAGMTLTGGTNGVVNIETIYEEYLKVATKARWQTMAITQDGSTINGMVAEAIKNMRENEGKFVQVVLANYTGADFEGVINSDAGVEIEDTTITASEATAWIAGITAGASITTSNTGKVWNGATKISNERTNAEIIEALQRGMMILSTNQNGDIKVEQDINSLHTFIPTKNRAFSKNRILRTLDEIGTTVNSMWESTYLGKVNNNATGRVVFRGDIIAYLTTLQDIEALQNFEGAEDVEVLEGTDLEGTDSDVVVCRVWVQPVDSMEKLYMTINVVG